MKEKVAKEEQSCVTQFMQAKQELFSQLQRVREGGREGREGGREEGRGEK